MKRVFSHAFRVELCADYIAARAASGGKPPYGWVAGMARRYNVDKSTIQRAIRSAQRRFGYSEYPPRRPVDFERLPV